MAKRQNLDLLKQGRQVWNSWRAEHSEIKPDLSRANLSKTNLSSVNFSRADLSKANLREADLSGADLREADLREANLYQTNLSIASLYQANLSTANLIGARLSRTNLSYADLSYAKLNYANLREANLSRADLNYADLSEASIWGTLFTDVDLNNVKGLTTVKHEGPSIIGIDTIYRSRGNIPEGFLREAGIPDTFLDYLRSLIGQAIQYFTCFISHSSKDQSFCDRLYVDLRTHHVPSWYFPEDATWGKTVWGEIDRSIKVYDKLVVVCSEHSLQSGPVLREIERALQLEDREGKHVLFPIRIDNYLFEQWEHERKADVLSKVVGDFRGWNRSATKYETAFQKLLKALNKLE